MAGSSMLRVQETRMLASSTAEVILEKDMDVILPKDMGWAGFAEFLINNWFILMKSQKPDHYH